MIQKVTQLFLEGTYAHPKDIIARWIDILMVAWNEPKDATYDSSRVFNTYNHFMLFY
jgi:hypothetical protein